jgi:hypothetical protein
LPRQADKYDKDNKLVGSDVKTRALVNQWLEVRHPGCTIHADLASCQLPTLCCCPLTSAQDEHGIVAIAGGLQVEQSYWNGPVSTIVFERVFKKWRGGAADESVVAERLEHLKKEVRGWRGWGRLGVQPACPCTAGCQLAGCIFSGRCALHAIMVL